MIFTAEVVYVFVRNNCVTLIWWPCFNVKVWPNACNTYKIVAWCCDMCWTNWPNARNISNSTCGSLCVPGPWHSTSGPSAYDLGEQCSMNVAKRVQHHTTSKMLHEKFDRFKFDPTSSNMLQHTATGWSNVCNMKVYFSQFRPNMTHHTASSLI